MKLLIISPSPLQSLARQFAESLVFYGIAVELYVSEEGNVHSIAPWTGHILLLDPQLFPGKDLDLVLEQNGANRDAAFQWLALVTDQQYLSVKPPEGFHILEAGFAFQLRLLAVMLAIGIPAPIPAGAITYIRDQSKNFIGRQFVFDAINTFLDNRESGYFILQGFPGMGKSAVLASLVQKSGCPCYFIGQNRQDQAPAFMDNIARQLTNQYGLSPAAGPAESAARFRYLLDQVSSLLQLGEKFILVIDGLDELDANSLPIANNALYLPEVLPPGIFIILSRRKSTPDLRFRSDPKILDLDDYAENNRKDAEQYIKNELETVKGRTWLNTQAKGRTEVIAFLADKSGSNFMYIRYVLPALFENKEGRPELHDLPSGLLAYYRWHWKKMGMKADPLPHEKLLLIYYISVFRSALSIEMLNEFTGMPAVAISSVLNAWEEFLRVESREKIKYYSIYHASFRDFLYEQDTTRAAGINLKEIKQSVVNHFVKLFDQ